MALDQGGERRFVAVSGEAFEEVAIGKRTSVSGGPGEFIGLANGHRQVLPRADYSHPSRDEQTAFGVTFFAYKVGWEEDC
jgi:hypothetical protein